MMMPYVNPSVVSTSTKKFLSLGCFSHCETKMIIKDV